MTARHLVALLLVSSATLLGVAPLAMPADYSWVTHTTSESAAQGIEHAWIASVGFALFGVAVGLLVLIVRRRWGAVITFLHMLFAVSMIGAAVFATVSWRPTDIGDPLETSLHSLFATLMGFAFVFALVAKIVRARMNGRGWPWFTILAATVATLVPLAMFEWSSHAGVLQRSMFIVAYVWYGSELIRPRETPSQLRRRRMRESQAPHRQATSA